jgi:hypothetical protein
VRGALWFVLLVACGGSGPREPRHSDSRNAQAAGRSAEPTLNECRKRKDDSFDLTSDEVLLRRGLGDRSFGDTATTERTPIQVCGILGEVKWLTRITCADGSRPWGDDIDKAHAARQGSMPGPARCGEFFGPMIDLYEVPCPEKKYAVYIDMYECGPGEELWKGVRIPD